VLKKEVLKMQVPKITEQVNDMIRLLEREKKRREGPRSGKVPGLATIPEEVVDTVPCQDCKRLSRHTM
jgi:hypothetical protein